MLWSSLLHNQSGDLMEHFTGYSAGNSISRVTLIPINSYSVGAVLFASLPYLIRALKGRILNIPIKNTPLSQQKSLIAVFIHPSHGKIAANFVTKACSWMCKTKFPKLFLTAFVGKLSKWKGSETGKRHCKIISSMPSSYLSTTKANTDIILGIHGF